MKGIHHYKVGVRIDRSKGTCHCLIEKFLTVVRIAPNEVIRPHRYRPARPQRLELRSHLSWLSLTFYCPTGLFNGISPDWPHCTSTTLSLLLCMTYQIPFDGRHTAKSALRSPS